MKQKHIDQKLGRKIELKGKSISEVLSKEEGYIISFWTLVEIELTKKETLRRKDTEGEFIPLSEDEFDAKVDEMGNEILARFNGSHKDAVNLLKI